MKKLTLLSLFVLLPFLTFAQADSTESSDEDKQEMARDAAFRTCSLLSAVLNEIHPEIIRMIDEMLVFGAAEGFENLSARMENMSTGEQAEVNAGLQIMMNIQSHVDQEEAKQLDMDYGDYLANDPEFKNMMRDSMKDIPVCEIPEKILRLAETDS